MNVKIQSVKFDADKKLIKFVDTRMSKLDRFAEDAIGAEVIMKVDKNHDHGNKVATIILNMPGNDLVAETRAKTFEEAVTEGIEALKKQIAKHREKFNKTKPSKSVAAKGIKTLNEDVSEHEESFDEDE